MRAIPRYDLMGAMRQHMGREVPVVIQRCDDIGSGFDQEILDLREIVDVMGPLGGYWPRLPPHMRLPRGESADMDD